MHRAALRPLLAPALFILLGLLGCHRMPSDVKPVPIDSPVSPEQLAKGRELFRTDCAGCHGQDAGGGGPAAHLAVPPPDLTTLAARHDGVFPREHVIRVVAGEEEVPAHGRSGMPIWQRRYGPPNSGAAAVASFYAQRNLELLLGYLRTLQRPAAAGTRRAPPGAPWPPRDQGSPACLYLSVEASFDTVYELHRIVQSVLKTSEAKREGPREFPTLQVGSPSHPDVGDRPNPGQQPRNRCAALPETHGVDDLVRDRMRQCQAGTSRNEHVAHLIREHLVLTFETNEIARI